MVRSISVSKEVLDEKDIRILELYGSLLAALYERGLLKGETADDIIARYQIKAVHEDEQ